MFLIMLNTHVAFVLSVEPLVFNGCKKVVVCILLIVRYKIKWYCFMSHSIMTEFTLILGIFG